MWALDCEVCTEKSTYHYPVEAPTQQGSYRWWGTDNEVGSEGVGNTGTWKEVAQSKQGVCLAHWSSSQQKLEACLIMYRCVWWGKRDTVPIPRSIFNLAISNFTDKKIQPISFSLWTHLSNNSLALLTTCLCCCLGRHLCCKISWKIYLPGWLVQREKAIVDIYNLRTISVFLRERIQIISNTIINAKIMAPWSFPFLAASKCLYPQKIAETKGNWQPKMMNNLKYN